MIDVLVIGTGEYVTGINSSKNAISDKDLGIIALTLFDLRKVGLVRNIILCGRNGNRFESIKKHFKDNLESQYMDLDTSFEFYPKNGLIDELAYRQALKQMLPKSAVIIFTPDETHFKIAKEALKCEQNILVAKPLVKNVAEHTELINLAKSKKLLGMTEFHKRFDPIYQDAIRRAKSLGDFSFMNSYMSQPKSQLLTFKQWAGQSSDISYYLNSHHIDILCTILNDKAEPLSVYANQSVGIGRQLIGRKIEDTISLIVKWQNKCSLTEAHSIHTSSWIAPQSDVHSQQRFFYLGEKGEIIVDQAHRGYSIATDESKLQSPNPLFMSYTPQNNQFVGQSGYGYQSIKSFLEACIQINSNKISINYFESSLPTLGSTINVTAILQAGRLSLDEERVVLIKEIL
jgi:D-galacturonate reductase